MFNLQLVVRIISVMTQEEFTYMASEIRAKAVSIAAKFGYSTDDSEDIAQDVMLRLWSLHEQLSDATHLKASAIITAKRACIDRWRTTHQYKEIDDAMPPPTRRHRTTNSNMPNWSNGSTSKSTAYPPPRG